MPSMLLQITMLFFGGELGCFVLFCFSSIPFKLICQFFIFYFQENELKTYRLHMYLVKNWFNQFSTTNTNAFVYPVVFFFLLRSLSKQTLSSFSFKFSNPVYIRCGLFFSFDFGVGAYYYCYRHISCVVLQSEAIIMPKFRYIINIMLKHPETNNLVFTLLALEHAGMVRGVLLNTINLP